MATPMKPDRRKRFRQPAPGAESNPSRRRGNTPPRRPRKTKTSKDAK